MTVNVASEGESVEVLCYAEDATRVWCLFCVCGTAVTLLKWSPGNKLGANVEERGLCLECWLRMDSHIWHDACIMEPSVTL